MGTKKKERQVYLKEFKAEAVALAEKHEKPVRQIAEDLGVNENMLYRWIQQTRGVGGAGLPPGLDLMWAIRRIVASRCARVIFSRSKLSFPNIR
jgi:transposase-like protein